MDSQKVEGRILPFVKQFALWAQLLNLQIIRKYHIKFINGLRYSEDAVFMMKYAIYSESIQYIPNPVYIYRINTNSACRTNDKALVAYHQFWAAKEMSSLINNFNNLTTDEKHFIREQERIRIKWGIEAHYQSDGNFSLADAKDLYRKLYQNRFDLFLFYYVYIRITIYHVKMAILNMLKR